MTRSETPARQPRELTLELRMQGLRTIKF